MNQSDRRDRDRILKMLRRKPVDPLAPPKKTTPELMSELTASFQDEYQEGVEGRAAQAQDLFNNIGRKDG